MVDQQPIQDPMIPDGSREEAGVYYYTLEEARGIMTLEWELTDHAIAGVVRNLKTLLKRQGDDAADRVVRPHYEDPWTVTFKTGEADYTVSHDDVWRPTKHYLTERVILERKEGGATNRALLCTIQGLKHQDEQVHIGPKAELTVGDNEPVSGVDALAGLTDAFPELGLVWISRDRNSTPAQEHKDEPDSPQADEVVLI